MLQERRAAYALAELEERIEEEQAPGLVAALVEAVGRCEAAAGRIEELRRRCREAEARLGEREAVRVHARRSG